MAPREVQVPRLRGEWAGPGERLLRLLQVRPRVASASNSQDLKGSYHIK